MFGLRAALSLTHFQGSCCCLSSLVSKGLGGSLPKANQQFELYSFGPQPMKQHTAWPILQEGKLRCREGMQLDWVQLLLYLAQII